MKLLHRGLLTLGALLTPVLAEGQHASLTPRDSALVVKYHDMLEAKFLRRDAQPFAALTDTAYVVITPGGLLESREAALRGVQNFRMDSLTLTMPRVQRGDVVVLTAELWLFGGLEATGPDGTIRRANLTGPYRVLAIFADDVGSPTRLLAESVTPVRRTPP